MNANQKSPKTRLEYMAAYGTPHAWLWVLVPGGAWAVLNSFRASMSDTVYIALRSTIVLLLAFSVISACLRLFGVRPARRTRREWSESRGSGDSQDSPSHESSA